MHVTRPPWEPVVPLCAMADVSLGTDCTFARFAAFTMTCAKRDYKNLIEPIAKRWEIFDVESCNIKVLEVLLSKASAIKCEYR
jgi:hypothetical protein